MKKLVTMIGLSLLAFVAVGCSNGSSNNNNTAAYQSCLSQYGATATTYCSSLTGTNVGTQACYGTYYFYNGSTWMQGICSGTNCSGYTLYNTAGQQVRCQ